MYNRTLIGGVNISKRSEAANQPFCAELNKTQFFPVSIVNKVSIEQQRIIEFPNT